jgi:hypothetical protein
MYGTRRIEVQASPGKNSRPYSKNNKSKMDWSKA